MALEKIVHDLVKPIENLPKNDRAERLLANITTPEGRNTLLETGREMLRRINRVKENRFMLLEEKQRLETSRHDASIPATIRQNLAIDINKIESTLAMNERFLLDAKRLTPFLEVLDELAEKIDQENSLGYQK